MHPNLASWLRTALLSATTALAALPAQAQPALPGASASGYAWGDFVIGCTTCSHLPITLSGTPVQDANGATSAAVDYLGGPVATPDFAGYTLAGGVGYSGYAGFEGALQTPLLRAKAHTDNEQAFIIVDPDVPVGIDLYQASVNAGTQMLYQYLGAQAGSYTFHFSVDGQVSNDQSSVFASAALFGGPGLDLETGQVDFGYASFEGQGVNGPLTPFAGAFSVSIDVNPGDSFWLVANLSVLASMTYSSADVTVDAYDTLRVSSISGDTGLLQVMAVPEPPAVLLLALGLVVVGLAKTARRQHQRPL